MYLRKREQDDSLQCTMYIVHPTHVAYCMISRKNNSVQKKTCKISKIYTENIVSKGGKSRENWNVHRM